MKTQKRKSLTFVKASIASLETKTSICLRWAPRKFLIKCTFLKNEDFLWFCFTILKVLLLLSRSLFMCLLNIKQYSSFCHSTEYEFLYQLVNLIIFVIDTLQIFFYCSTNLFNYLNIAIRTLSTKRLIQNDWVVLGYYTCWHIKDKDDW